MSKIPLSVNYAFQGPETCSILLRSGQLAPTLEDITWILGVRSEGEPFLSIPPGLSTSYASDSKELLGIPFEKIRGKHDSDIHLGKLRRPFYKGKAPVEEDDAGVSESMQGESSQPSSSVGCDTPDHGDGSAFFDEDTVPPQASLADEEAREIEDPGCAWAGYDRGRARGAPGGGGSDH
ncbi:hypothetical protein AMTR_s00035p00152670 [Amborella trichopoda]|uniref:Uncharacterized protein n=1 Tax=Amborella trichopoda TaxID=13333 RepID=W1PXB2_AMBTC|nr:hypothetical protein AMTR_s00035p00152670 [Amborella trichopoda]